MPGSETHAHKDHPVVKVWCLGTPGEEWRFLSSVPLSPTTPAHRGEIMAFEDTATAGC